MARGGEDWFRTNEAGLLGEIRAIVRRIDRNKRDPTQAEKEQLAKLRQDLLAFRKGQDEIQEKPDARDNA